MRRRPRPGLQRSFIAGRDHDVTAGSQAVDIVGGREEPSSLTSLKIEGVHTIRIITGTTPATRAADDHKAIHHNWAVQPPRYSYFRPPPSSGFEDRICLRATRPGDVTLKGDPICPGGDAFGQQS
jgi:hypothetical protein